MLFSTRTISLMKESQLNVTLKNSFINYGGWCHKISDGVGGIGIQNPFDIFGIINNKPLYQETKLVKGLYAFNFNRIEKHQFENLTFIENLLSKTIPDKFYSLIVVGFYKPRKFFYVMFFNIKTLNEFKKSGIMSIKKKELQKYIEEGKYLSVVWETDKTGKRKQFVKDINRIDEVII